MRARTGRPAEEPAAPAAPDQSSAPAPLGKHCWVVDYPRPPGAWPALLCQWKQRNDGGWLPEVAVIGGDPREPEIVALWIEAEYLRPATG